MSDFNLIKWEGKPLEKLIEVISSAIGTIYKPKAIRKEADAKAYEIEIIERAKSRALAEGKEIEAASFERMQDRLLHREMKRQSNIDAISSVAAEQLSQEESVSEEPVSEDWTTRFFNMAEDISDIDMQALWGKILAGEVKQPKSFSLRTLELIRNLSKYEANIFLKASEYAIETSGASFIFKDSETSEKFLSYTERSILVEVGLLNSDQFLSYQLLETPNDASLVMTSGNIILVTKKKAGTAVVNLDVYAFSKSGVELLKLLKPTVQMTYLSKLGKSLINLGVTVQYANILKVNSDGTIQHTLPMMDFI
ncbi:DUF2806 domain-containing protein [Pedobacter rhodius]|uniref:DUF2806 domain-containing protein n=1 Tax=Pedobacter rhodius TaxID=3004098 RepID=A0ABT4KSG6_9SPHI|nr:DUF2806 domain-containing protein [Pedobacter sp. SJ11]MCZ4221876.1 DUF2806 domain-containing protein [Pedobacter sp. SJ11]